MVKIANPLPVRRHAYFSTVGKYQGLTTAMPRAERAVSRAVVIRDTLPAAPNGAKTQKLVRSESDQIIRRLPQSRNHLFLRRAFLKRVGLF